MTRHRLSLRTAVGLAAVFLLVFASALVLLERGRIRDWLVERGKPPVPSEQPAPTPSATLAVRPTTTPHPSPSPTPTAINLAVPFYSQAPRGDWSLPWQEACEEASVILVDAFWAHQELSVAQMEDRILRLVDWQKQQFGYYEHTTAAETARMIREVMGYRRVEVVEDADIDDIRDHVLAGRPVIVPLAGRLLGNKFYTQPGPVYHMLVVKGIAENGDIITNDVGTRHGRNLTYAPDVFLHAMHDVPDGGSTWPPGADPAEYIATGPRRIVVVYPNE